MPAGCVSDSQRSNAVSTHWKEELSVLFPVRSDLWEFPGGDTVQILNTARALTSIGLQVTITSDPRVDMWRFDCVHLWHLERVHETIIFYLQARRADRPVLLSPIYYPCSTPADVSNRRAGIENAKNVYRLLVARTTVERLAVCAALRVGWSKGRRLMLDQVQMLLPNSQAEAEVLAQERQVPVPICVIRNAADEQACASIPRVPVWARRRRILCVGHFDPRKNQLELIRALRPLGLPITFIGRARRHHQSYFRRCLDAAGPNMEFLGALPQEAVLRAMGQSQVHVCSSLSETPGLANLEAARLGCVLVLPDCPPIREYFESVPFYFTREDWSLCKPVSPPHWIACTRENGRDWNFPGRYPGRPLPPGPSKRIGMSSR